MVHIGEGYGHGRGLPDGALSVELPSQRNTVDGNRSLTDRKIMKREVHVVQYGVGMRFRMLVVLPAAWFKIGVRYPIDRSFQKLPVEGLVVLWGGVGWIGWVGGWVGGCGSGGVGSDGIAS